MEVLPKRKTAGHSYHKVITLCSSDTLCAENGDISRDFEIYKNRVTKTCPRLIADIESGYHEQKDGKYALPVTNSLLEILVPWIQTRNIEAFDLPDSQFKCSVFDPQELNTLLNAWIIGNRLSIPNFKIHVWQSRRFDVDEVTEASK
jgi:hypothetical protein